MIAVAAVFYFKTSEGPVIGRIKFGHEYHLSEIRPTERFAGATMDQASYFKINEDEKTGELYLKGLTATTAPIRFIVIDYQEGAKETTIIFEYIIDAGEKTTIQTLKAISTTDCITIKTVESHSIQYIIQENPDETDELDYNVTIMVFNKEATKWNAELKLVLSVASLHLS